jgi:glycosyltransferase involved in cell wall biosynthesis
MESEKLKVLWVARGNGSGAFKAVVKNQFDSLGELKGIAFFSLVLEGNGIALYLKNFFRIRTTVKRNKIDIIHAHYSFTAFICALTFSAPVVVSLMGSDVIANKWRRRIIVLFSRLLWKRVIVKTEQMKTMIGLEGAEVLPNGVDMTFYAPLDSISAKEKLGWSPQKFHIVFPSDSSRKEKNFQMLAHAVSILDEPLLEVHEMKGLDKSQVREYYAAADVVVMTSLREGSPNAIKEALSMDKCVISTNVGDVKDLIHGVEGAWMVSFDSAELAARISSVIKLKDPKSNGRKAMERLSSPRVASRLETIYLSCLA